MKKVQFFQIILSVFLGISFFFIKAPSASNPKQIQFSLLEMHQIRKKFLKKKLLFTWIHLKTEKPRKKYLDKQEIN